MLLKETKREVSGMSKKIKDVGLTKNTWKV